MRTTGEKLRLSDEAEGVQSVSYSHIRSLSGLYNGTMVCLREARHLPRALFATVMCKVAYLAFKWGPIETAMYNWAALLSKGSPIVVM